MTEYPQRHEPHFLPIWHSSLSAKRCSQLCQHLHAYCGCSWLIPTISNTFIRTRAEKVWAVAFCACQTMQFVTSRNVVHDLLLTILFHPFSSLVFAHGLAARTRSIRSNTWLLFSSCIRLILLECSTYAWLPKTSKVCLVHASAIAIIGYVPDYRFNGIDWDKARRTHQLTLAKKSSLEFFRCF